MDDHRFFTAEEYDRRLETVRERIEGRGLQGCLVSRPENICYLTGLDYQGYFAYQMLVIPLDGQPILVVRAMERATLRDQVRGIRHMGYSDGVPPLPAATDKSHDVVLSTQAEQGGTAGLEPWSMSIGVSVGVDEELAPEIDEQVRVTCEAIREAGLDTKKVGVEMNSMLLPANIARSLFDQMSSTNFVDASGLVDMCRLVQSPAELECTRRAASISDAMMRSAIQNAGPGMNEQTVMLAIYRAMLQSGGTYPAFLPLLRSTRTLDHEHGTWADHLLLNGDYLFLEMSGCYRRYHAPIGRLVFIGKAPDEAKRINEICQGAILKAQERMGPGIEAREVYRAWQSSIDEEGLKHYKRHHCGYAVGIGFPPSWSGGGVPIGLRENAKIKLRPGMAFHLMSWLLRTGRGDSFLSDTVVVTENGCELLTTTSRDLIVK